MLLGSPYECYQLGLCLPPRNLSPYVCAQALAVETGPPFPVAPEYGTDLAKITVPPRDRYPRGLLLSADGVETQVRRGTSIFSIVGFSAESTVYCQEDNGLLSYLLQELHL